MNFSGISEESNYNSDDNIHNNSFCDNELRTYHLDLDLDFRFRYISEPK